LAAAHQTNDATTIPVQEPPEPKPEPKDLLRRAPSTSLQTRRPRHLPNLPAIFSSLSSKGGIAASPSNKFREFFTGSDLVEAHLDTDATIIRGLPRGQGPTSAIPFERHRF